MKLKVIGLHEAKNYVAIELLIPPATEKVNAIKEALEHMPQDARDMMAPFMGTFESMIETMSPPGANGYLLRIPMDWDDFQKLDLKLGDSVEYIVRKIEK